MTLLSNMGGGWWNVAVDNRNTFLPEAVLADVPKDVPAYSGIFKDLRDVDFWVVHGYDISSFKMAWNAADAWIVVREDEKPVLAHWVLQGDTWTEAGRVSLLPEHGTWYVGDMKQDMQAEVPWFSVATIWEEEEVNMISTFEQASEGWVLKNVCIGKPEYVDDVGWEVINGRIFTPAEGGLEVTEDGETRFAALDTPVAVEVAAYSATELAAACMAASKVLP